MQYGYNASCFSCFSWSIKQASNEKAYSGGWQLLLEHSVTKAGTLTQVQTNCLALTKINFIPDKMVVIVLNSLETEILNHDIEQIRVKEVWLGLSLFGLCVEINNSIFFQYFRIICNTVKVYFKLCLRLSNLSLSFSDSCQFGQWEQSCCKQRHVFQGVNRDNGMCCLHFLSDKNDPYQ